MLRRLFNSPLLRNVLFTAVLLGGASGLGYIANRYPLERDITHNANNSLDPVSVKVLEQIHGTVNVTAYATEQDVRLGDIRKIIRDFVSLYQRYKPDIKLVFIDPVKEAESARAARVQLNGEMVVEYAGRSEHLTQINEPIFTAALLRLAHTRDQTVMYLDGHGERRLDGMANYDLGAPFGAKLRQNGYRIGSVNLAIAQDVPSNASVLVVTQPQVDLLPGEVNKLLRYIERGGNLLWLVDAGPLHGLERLADKLDLMLPPGVVIDPAATRMNAPPTWALGATYPPHAITNNFSLITAFPSARPLIWNETPDWEHHVLVETAPLGWVTRKTIAPNEKNPRFDKQHDARGPAIIALALQRQINDRDQRIVVVGNGAFLSNTFAGNGGNVDLGVNMVNWLAGEEHLITLQPRAAKDSYLALSQMQLNFISIGFMLGLPLLLAGVGATMWWKRRRG